MMKKVLVIAAHTDDESIGCGGTISKLLYLGYEVKVAVFSICKESIPDNLEKNILEKEYHIATKILGLKKSDSFIFDYPVRKFSYYRQEILEELVKIRKNYEPDIIFTHSKTDIHQDHQVMYNETVRAFKGISILGYELPWNCVTFHPRCFVSLSEKNVDTKIKAIASYESQQKLGRKYVSSDIVKSLCVIRGLQSGNDLAEAFDVYRLNFPKKFL